MSALLNPALFSRLDAGTLLVLPTARSAAHLRRIFDERQQEAQRPSWEPANVQSWDQWTQSLWTSLVLNGAEPRLLLNSAQEQSLWDEIIRLDTTYSGLNSFNSLATLARSGFQRAAAYNATHRLQATVTTEDSRIFSDWAAAFTALCRKRYCVPAALLESVLVHAIENGTLTLPSTVTFVACDTLTPAQHALLDSLGAAGCDILHLSLTSDSIDTDRSAATFQTEQEELSCAIQWIRTRLEITSSSARSPTIALLVPDLAETQTHVERTLRDILAPELQNIEEDLSSTPWEMNGVSLLTTLPMVSAAIDIVRWTLGGLPIERVGMLLLSPYLGTIADRDAAACFDAQTLRRTQQLRPEMELDAMLRLSSKVDLPRWLRNLHIEVQRIGDLARSRSYADWTELFRSLLRSANWPGDRELSGTELATVEAWEGALDTIATLDFSGQRVGMADTVAALAQQLDQATLQLPSTGTPLQVMTPAQAEGCFFDTIVYLRANEANLPTRPTAHPLLSWQLQRSLSMPGTDSAVDIARARRDLHALLANAHSALFTHAQLNDDGKLRPSPLLSELNLAPANIPSFPPAASPVPLDAWPDITPLPTAPTHVAGGARVLQLQAACGFRAFAEFRLHAAEPEARSLGLGLDPSEAGNIIHRTMDLFWRTVRTQQALLQMSPADRERTLRSAIADALSRRLPPEGAWDTAYIEMQKTRIFTLLSQWLEKELERGPFSVLEREISQEIPIGPLTLEVRFDRIDAVHDGDQKGFVLVDYKSGRGGHPSAWQEDRPLDPQLPLYSLLYEPAEMKGLAFANLRLGKDMKWLGYQAQDGILPRSRTNQTVDFEQQISEWHTVLTTLAEDFYHGNTGVDPAHYPQTCEHCAQRILCRIDPSLLQADDEDPATEERNG